MFYATIEADGDTAVILLDYTRGVPSGAGQYSISAFASALVADWRARRTTVVNDVKLDPRFSDSERAAYASVSAQSAVGVPLIKGGRLVALFGVNHSMPRVWTDGDVVIVEETAERIWTAMERARVEREMRESEARYRALFTSIDEAYALCRIVTDAQGKPSDYLLVEVNPAFEKMTGITPEAAQGATARELVPGIEDWWIETYGRVALQGEVVRFENRVAEMDRWFDAYAGPVGEPGSGLFTLVFTDVTQRKQAEASLKELNETLEQRVKERTEELERSNVRFTQAFTLAPFPALISTLDKQETFLEVDEAFLEFTRYEREEIVGKQAFDLKMWSSTHDQRKLAEAQKDGRGFRDLALQLIDKEGNLLDVLLSAAVIRIDGHHGYLKMFYDVTERKRSDEQMTLAVDSVMAEASWFSQEFVGRLNHLRSGGRLEDYRPLDLSPREREVLIMVARGWTNKRISEELELKQQTIRNYLSSIFDKIGVHSRTEAAVWARKRGLVAD